MKTTSIALGLSIFLLTGAAAADDDCDDPVSGWQPRENLRQQLEADGWEVYRIKVDDGCYEVKGRNEQGRRVEASFAPSDFQLMEMEGEDEEDDDDRRNRYQGNSGWSPENDDDDDRDDDEREDDDDEGRGDNANGNNNGPKPMPSNGIVKGRPSVSVQ